MLISCQLYKKFSFLHFLVMYALYSHVWYTVHKLLYLHLSVTSTSCIL